jgi:diacylglycerol kinase (ATP)
MKNKNLVDSFNYAINGIISTVRSERNMKIHIIAAALVMILSLFYDLTRNEFLIVCITIAVVIICELFNTAIEVIIDTLIGIYHPKAKLVKDTSAGAVFVAALLSIVVGYFIFFDRVSTSLEIGIIRIKQAPMHITVIAIILTLMVVLLLKSFFKKVRPLAVECRAATLQLLSLLQRQLLFGQIT